MELLIGGAIGGVALAAVGGKGGESIAHLTQWSYDNTIGKAIANKPGIKERVAKKEEALNGRQQELEGKAKDLQEKAENYRAEHRTASQGLKEREDELLGNETKVAGDIEVVDARIEKNANSDYQGRAARPDASLDAKGEHQIVGKRDSLKQWDEKLNKWQGELNGFRDELNSWEKKLDKKIDIDAGAIFAEERKPIDSHFGSLQKELDAFEAKLTKYEADINSRIAERYRQGINSQKPGVESDLASARSDKAQSERELGDARLQRDNARARKESANSQLSSAQNRLNSALNEQNNLRNRINDLNNRISRLEAELRNA